MEILAATVAVFITPSLNVSTRIVQNFRNNGHLQAQSEPETGHFVQRIAATKRTHNEGGEQYTQVVDSGKLLYTESHHCMSKPGVLVSNVYKF